MKDYSNYHDADTDQRIVTQGQEIFEHALNGYEGEDVFINDVAKRVVIHTKYTSNTYGDLRYVLGRIADIEWGYLVKWNDENWIIHSKPEDNGIYRKSELYLCNNIFTLKGEATQTIIGYDSLGRPVPEITEGTDTYIPCIVESTVYVSGSDKPINLPDGRLKVTLPYTEHEQIAVGKNFNMYGETYQIKNVDKTKSINGVGLLILTGERSN